MVGVSTALTDQKEIVSVSQSQSKPTTSVNNKVVTKIETSSRLETKKQRMKSIKFSSKYRAKKIYAKR